MRPVVDSLQIIQNIFVSFDTLVKNKEGIIYKIYTYIGLLIKCFLSWNINKTEADFQNVNCFVFEQSIVFHKAAVRNIYNVFYFKTSSMCIFNAVKKQSGMGFEGDILFINFPYLQGASNNFFFYKML